MSQAKEQNVEKLQRQAGVRLALDVGMRMAISIDGQRENEDSRIASDLVGMVHFEYLILRLPWIPGVRSRLVSGAGATIRFVSDGELCGFHVDILNHIAKPALLAIVAYPEVIEKLSLRQYRRVQCALPASVHSRRADATGVIADLSRGGCRLVLDARGQGDLRQMVPGDEIVLRTNLDTSGVPQSVNCKVRSVDLDTSKVTLGVAFTDANEGFTSALSRFLDYSALLL